MRAKSLPLLGCLLALGLGVPAWAQEPKQDDDEPNKDAEIKEAVKAKLGVDCQVKDGWVTVNYGFAKIYETDDFQHKGWDKVDVGGDGLELGVGSRKQGLFLHKLELDGDFEIDVNMWLGYGGGGTTLGFYLTKKVSVAWGQRLVKGKKAYTKNGKGPDPTLFKEQRKVAIKLKREGNRITVTFDGRRMDTHQFKKSELKKLTFGVFASDTRFFIQSLNIKAQVNP